MAANIEIRNGVASYVENGRKERAWHNLGQVYDGQITVKEALELSHADYKVEMKQVFAVTPAIQEAMESGQVSTDLLLDAIVSGRKATMRMDLNKPLGIVSDNYGVVQNSEAFQFIDTLCTGGKGDVPVIECAGVLGHGERVFITAKFPEQIILDNKTDDRVDMYIVFTTSHDGTGAVNCMVTPTRVVCNNTLNFALRHNAGKISLRHTSGITNRLDLTRKENQEFAFRTLNMYNIYKKSLEESFDHLRNIKLSERQLQDLMASVILTDSNLKLYQEHGINHEDISSVGRNQFNKVMEVIHCGVGQDIVERGTGLWAINGLTTYFQNEKNYRNEEVKMDSILQGHAAHKLQKAYDMLAMAV
jgi:phage/plasmid-like protein (TIGR03299 family)